MCIHASLNPATFTDDDTPYDPYAEFGGVVNVKSFFPFPLNHLPIWVRQIYCLFNDQFTVTITEKPCGWRGKS